MNLKIISKQKDRMTNPARYGKPKRTPCEPVWRRRRPRTEAYRVLKLNTWQQEYLWRSSLEKRSGFMSRD